MSDVFDRSRGAEFSVRNCHIRYNTHDPQHTGMQISRQAPAKPEATLVLADFKDDHGDSIWMTNCHLERDKTLPPGTMVIVPR